MRRILGLTAAIGLLAGLGCTHEVCDCCQDICGACQYPGCGSRAAAVAAPLPAPAVKSEQVPASKQPPAPAKPAEKADAGRKIESPNLDD